MAKHATVWRMQVQPGKVDELRKLMGSMEQQRRIQPMGWAETVIGSRKGNASEVWGVVLWDTSDNYYKNAESSEQNADYQKMRSLLAADPEWFDCDVLEERRA